MDSEKADKRRTGSYEVQYWKRTSGTPWTGRKMDRWVLAQINPKTSLEAKITKLPCDKNEPALIQAHHKEVRDLWKRQRAQACVSRAERGC